MFIAFLLVVLLGVVLPAGFFQWHHQRQLAKQVLADVTFLATTAVGVLQHEVERAGLDQVRQRMETFGTGAGLYLYSVNATNDAWLEVGPGGATNGDGQRVSAIVRSPEVLAGLRQSNGMMHNGVVITRVPFEMEPFDHQIPPSGWLMAAAVRLKGQYYWEDLLLIVAAATMAAALLAIGFRMAMVRWLCTRLDETAAVARAIGAGDLKQRAPIHNSKELDELSGAVNRMADGIASQIKTISEQKTQLETVLNSMKEGVLVIDRQCCITAVNRAMVDIFPDAEGAIGRRPLEVILSPELQQACEETVGGVSGLRASRSFQIEPMRDQVYEVTMTRLRAVGGENGEECMGAVAVFHDISQLTRLERVRRDFVANVSHELRTPLTSIKGYAETLILGLETKNDGKSSAEQNFLEVILKHANQMTKTVNDLLHLARLESGERQFEFRTFNAAEAFSQAYKECLHLVEESGLAVRNQLPEDGVTVFADQNRLAQVFRNLLENALKYGIPTAMDSQSADPAQGVVTVSCQEREEDVVFSIKDQGPGIPKADRERIFERFYRVEKHRLKHKAGSSGLGLAIVRHIVEKSGGAVWVESPVQDGHGTIFSFSLPKARPEDDV